MIAHEPVLAELRAAMAAAAEGPQHALVIGGPGAGKSTLLRRLAEQATGWAVASLPDDPYPIGDVAGLWAAALRALGADDALPPGGDDLREATAYAKLRAVVGDQPLLLLVDGLDGVLARVGDDRALHRLRERLQHDRGLLLIGTTDAPIEATYHYDRPLYDQLTSVQLPPVDAPTLEAWLGRPLSPGWAVLRVMLDGQLEALDAVLRSDRPRREAVLEALERATPRYLRRLDALAPQAQRVWVGLARRDAALTADELATDLSIPRGAASGQLARLVERGWVRQADIGERAVGYLVRERAFALWRHLRSGPRERAMVSARLDALDALDGRGALPAGPLWPADDPPARWPDDRRALVEAVASA